MTTGIDRGSMGILVSAVPTRGLMVCEPNVSRSLVVRTQVTFNEFQMPQVMVHSILPLITETAASGLTAACVCNCLAEKLSHLWSTCWVSNSQRSTGKVCWMNLTPDASQENKKDAAAM